MTGRLTDSTSDDAIVWLGSIPRHWRIVRLGTCFRERREKVSDKEYPPLSVTRDGVVPQLENVAKSDDSDNRKRVCVGDFVINSRSDRRGSAGASTLDGSVSLISTVLVPSPLIDIRFAHYLLRSSRFQEEFYRHGNGIVADLWSTGFQEMKSIELPIPPLDEQREIARALDHEVDRMGLLSREQERLIDLLNEKRHATIWRAVTKGLAPARALVPSHVDWLGDIPSHWALPRLSARYEVMLGKMLDEKRITKTYLRPYLRNADVNWDRVNVENLPQMDVEPHEVERFCVRPGDLLICEGGAGVGQTAIWSGASDTVAYQKALHRLRPRNAHENPRYMYYCMRALVGIGLALVFGNVSTIPHLTGEKLRALRLPGPPRAEQDGIVAFLDVQCARIDELILEAKRSLELLTRREEALIETAVRGGSTRRESDALLGA